ncbi:dihydropyrimidine dehydrogenase [NADP(+)] [Anaeramoeba flamelloides]|uniref:dihydropyrimidine dehydrogenase (NADP(+)) n=1 Tax=Anaeramoeba flamelloides TaxID=1746091 RepID=A0ABQ8YE41_9EUKA|nr:dihydropyrimidine dehydrogenase [NADP(+)] [Anaeramoeba flamelloides]
MTSKKVSQVKDPELFKIYPKIKKTATVKPTLEGRTEKLNWKRNFKTNGKQKYLDFTILPHLMLSEKEAIQEAKRCLKCADAPCTKGCPVSIDIKAFIHCVSTRNFYGAAKHILSENPVGLSCGLVCPVSNLCQGNCNLNCELPINICGLQHFALDTFQKMKIRQIRDPCIDFENLPESYAAKIACIGCGPSSISTASFLARLGYKNITIFEKNSYPGGLSSTEIPSFRLPYEAVKWEVSLMQDLGVKVQYNTALGKNGMTLKKLKEDGYQTIFVGIGLPFPKKISIFNDLKIKNNFYTSKTFLPTVSKITKQIENENQLPKLNGHVLILGAGDTAIDCALTAFRCGAKRVSLCFRKSIHDMRAVEEELKSALEEGVELQPYITPKSINLDKSGKIVSCNFYRCDKDDQEKYYTDKTQEVTIKCKFIISAFGSQIFGEQELIDALDPLTFNQEGFANINCKTMQSNDEEWIFVGGDLAGGKMTVEAANDGKTAAWNIHCYIQKIYNNIISTNKEFKFPLFTTPVDLVDISNTIAGIKFVNPLGLASAPCSTSSSLIRRSFEAGWGFAVTKTFAKDRDTYPNISPRICSEIDENVGNNQKGFMNIELNSEKSMKYWLKAIQELKEDFPDRVVIASISAPFNKEDWIELALKSEKSGADAIELSMSCPHGLEELGMGTEIGAVPKLLCQVTKWVKAEVGIPVFVKLTPNVHDIRDLAKAALEGGADAITAIDTVRSMINIKFDGSGWPSVGKTEKRTIYGGLSGGYIKPLALKSISSINRKFPNLPILGVGGVDSGENALKYIMAGASALQVGSAIMNSDFTIINEMVLGLKCLLYMKSRSDLKEWEFQFPRMEEYPIKENVYTQSVPKFGKYLLQKIEKKTQIIINGNKDLIINKKEIKQSQAPIKIKELVGISNQKVVGWSDLSHKTSDHVVALIVDEENCLNCGKCYMSCTYDAIIFNEKTHIPLVTDDCTGCGLCQSVCPVIDCIKFVSRKIPYIIENGIDLEIQKKNNEIYEKEIRQN